MIKFGDIEYFILLDLQRKLKYRDYNKLGLSALNDLRAEVNIKIALINSDFRESKKK